MGFYERGKAGREGGVPLEDQECSNGSIYFMNADGTVWTVRITDQKTVPAEVEGAKPIIFYEVAPHKKVRDTGKILPAATYVCMHTRQAYADFSEAIKHGTCEKTVTP